MICYCRVKMLKGVTTIKGLKNSSKVKRFHKSYKCRPNLFVFKDSSINTSVHLNNIFECLVWFCYNYCIMSISSFYISPILNAQEYARIRDALQRNPGANIAAKCPRCAMQNVKQGTNNHLRCWNCRANYCFMCKALIQGNIAGHYNAMMPCDQHSAS